MGKKYGERTTKVEERIDPMTGEIITTREDVDIVAIGVPKLDRDMEYVRVYPAFFSSFLEQLKIHDGKARLAWYLVYKALKLPPNSNNEVTARNEELMEALNISRPSLLKYLKSLETLGIITRVSPRLPIYVVEKEMVYRGVVSRMKQKELEERAMMAEQAAGVS